MVTTSQAGDRVDCQCGKSLEVPTLRKLRELQPAESQGVEERPWGLSQAIFTVGLIMTCMLAAGGAYFAAVEPDPPAPFDPVARDTLVKQNLEQLSPAEVWGFWTNAYKPLAVIGFSPMQTQGELETLRQIEVAQGNRNRLLIAAAVVLVCSVVLYSLLPGARDAP